MKNIWDRVRKADQLISEKKVWQLEGEEKKMVLGQLIESIVLIANDLMPIMPATAKKILESYTSESISKMSPLFPRLT